MSSGREWGRTDGELLALAEHLDRWPKAEIAYYVKHRWGSIVGVGTVEGLIAILKKLGRSKEHVSMRFVRRKM